VEVTIPIPSFTGGVSTQPEALRLPQQAQESVNVIATVVEGAIRRPPTEYLGDLEGYPTAPSAAHSISLVEGDYLAAATSGGLQIYDADTPGSPLVIRNLSGNIAGAEDFAYLETPNPAEDLRFLTLADYTLVLNRSKTVDAGATLYPERESEALVHVKIGAYRKYYGIKIDHPGGDQIEVRFETYSSDGLPPGNPSPAPTPSIGAAEDSVKTDNIARELESLLKTGATTGPLGGFVVGLSGGLPSSRWTVERLGSVIRILRDDQTDFKISVLESQGGDSLDLVYKEVQLFQDLPLVAPSGMRVQVIGDPSDIDASYWVEFVAERTTLVGEMAEGYWRESVASGVRVGMDKNSLPHAIIRQADGEFRWTAIGGGSYPLGGEEYDIPDYGERTVGDHDSNPDPGFVGKTLRDMAVHEGRLCFISADSVSFSESAQPFNFYRTTVLDVLDSTRIERDAGVVRASQLSHAVSTGADLVLFADGHQILVSADGPLTPTSASMTVGGRYDSDPVCPPIKVRDSLFVATDRSGKGSVHEMVIGGDRRPSISRVDLTASAASYLGRVRELVTTPQLDVVITTSDDEAGLGVFTQFYNGERVQLAWQKFSFPDSPTIRHCWFSDTDLFLVFDYGGGIRLMKMRMAGFAGDGSKELLHLDERVDETQCTVLSLGRTMQVDLPFPVSSDTMVIEKDTWKTVQILSYEGNRLILNDTRRSIAMWIGRPFEFRLVLSKARRFDEQQAPVVGPELHLDYGQLVYHNSGPFDVTITDDIGLSYTSSFAGPYLGMGSNYQKIVPSSGSFKFSIRGRALERRVTISSTAPWPLRLVSMDIMGREHRQHGQRR